MFFLALIISTSCKSEALLPDYFPRVALSVALMLFAATPSAVVRAASLGELHVVSALSERLIANTTVTVSADEYLDVSCFSLAQPRSDGDIRIVKRVVFDLKAEGGHYRLWMRGQDSENEPIIRLLVRYACPQSMLVLEREYTALLDPRESVTATPYPAVIQRPAVLPTRPPITQVMTQAPVRLSERSPRRSTRATIRSTSTPEQGLRLQIALAPPDLNRSAPLDEKTALAMRERLLLLEADDQAAQLLQLKDRIAKLEKKLDHVAVLAEVASASPTRNAKSPTPGGVLAQPAESIWSYQAWWWLLVLLPVMVGGWFMRIRARGAQDNEQIFAPTEIREFEPDPVSASVASTESGQEWRDSEMAVVSPVNASEEIQLLLDHGLTAQALDLLKDEICHRPSALAMWMRLFETCVQQGDRVTFSDYAARFQAQFVSAALWQEVSALGSKLGLDIALALNEPSLLPVDHEPKGNDDFDLADYLTSAEKKDMPSAIDGDFVANFPTLDFFENKSVQGNAFTQIALDQFESEDAELAAIAGLLRDRQLDEAYLQLEHLLYAGTLEQRITASRWLDRLLPVRDAGH